MMAILGFTLAGMRVFMPEWAFKAEIPRDMRRYIGRWAQEATSDVYTREHRGIVTRIWHKVIPRRELMENVGEVPLDIRDPHYLDKPETVEPHTLEGAGSGESFPEPPAPLMDAMELVELVEKSLEDTETNKACVSMQTLLKEECGSKIPSDELPTHLGDHLTPKNQQKKDR
jgi:hypothetical protein